MKYWVLERILVSTVENCFCVGTVYKCFCVGAVDWCFCWCVCTDLVHSDKFIAKTTFDNGSNH